MTKSKRQTVILENDPLYKEKADWAQRFKNLIDIANNFRR